MMNKYTLIPLIFLLNSALHAQVVTHKIIDIKEPSWRRISSESGALEVPNAGNQQTASLIADIDGDGAQDFFIAERTTAPALTMYRYHNNAWKRHVIEAALLRIEAGSATFDIDGDGDLDVVFGGENRSNEVWWWENPYPDFDPSVPWKRYTIKKSGGSKHHDQLFGDFDGDGKTELVFWNQGDNRLIMAEIPEDPKSASSWPLTTVYEYSSDSEMEPLVGLEGYPAWRSINEHEGLTSIDVDGDGLPDIVGGGRWFKYRNGRFIENIIDASYTFSRSAAGDFIKGGRPEVILVVGDGLGPMYLYEWKEHKNRPGTGTWAKILLLEQLDNGHTIDVLDFNDDGNMDIFTAEMRFGEGNPDAKTRILFGDGAGHFQEMVIAQGYGVHEGKIADLDGDGDLDVLGKPYTWKAPLLNLWINDQ
ncbi:MAG: VCBS repeat-containing protein [Cyclobacteriaceae bacterium]